MNTGDIFSNEFTRLLRTQDIKKKMKLETSLRVR